MKKNLLMTMLALTALTGMSNDVQANKEINEEAQPKVADVKQSAEDEFPTTLPTWFIISLGVIGVSMLGAGGYRACKSIENNEDGDAIIPSSLIAVGVTLICQTFFHLGYNRAIEKYNTALQEKESKSIETVYVQQAQPSVTTNAIRVATQPQMNYVQLATEKQNTRE